MTDYSHSRWADKEFSERYAENADNIIQERQKLIGILKSFYGNFLGGKEKVSVLDLGCGDGSLTFELMKEFGNLSPTLVDGSEDMIERARAHLHRHEEGVDLIQASFQELLAGKFDLPSFDFVFSSLAIHHLDMDEKTDLFSYVHDILNDGGWFLNIDVVLPRSEELEAWYLSLWRDWVEEQAREKELDFDAEDLISRYKGNPDNKPDTLESQLSALNYLGFADVDCHYKNGIFAVYGGRKRASGPSIKKPARLS